ncbi:hypothetical protein HKD37_08G023122 [Glycine soja]
MHEDVGHVTPFILEGEPPQHPDGVHENPQERAQGDVDSYSLFPSEGPAPNALPQPNITGEPRNNPTQPMFLSRWRDLEAQVAPPMVEREMVTMIVDNLPVFYYEKLVGYMRSSFTDLVFTGERIEVGLKTGKFDYVSLVGASGRSIGTAGAKKKEGDAHTVTSTPAWPKPQQTPHALAQPRAPTPPQRGAPQASAPTRPHPANNAHLGTGSNTTRNFSPRIFQSPFPKWYNPSATCAYHGGTPGYSVEQCLALKSKVQGLIEAGWLTFQEDGPNIKTNPLANHGGGVVNAIKVSRSHGPKLLKDVTTSRRFIYKTIQKADMIPRGEHKEDSCLMHPGVLHDMETCSENSRAVSWRYAPPGGRKEEATDIGSLAAKVTNIIGLSGITHSGHVFAPPGLPTQPANAKEKAKVTEGQNVKVIPAPDEDVPTKELSEGREDCGKKEVSLEEASEFLRIIQQSEFKVIEQLNKTPARVSLLELLMSSEPHRALLDDVRKNISRRKNKGQGPRSEEQAQEVPSCHISISFVSAGLRCEGQVAAICDEDSLRRSNLVQPCPPGFQLGN